MNDSYRVETDLIGSRELPADAYYGIHSLRASENFAISGLPLQREMIAALGIVKKACARANRQAGVLDERTASAIEQACSEVADGQLDHAFIVDRIQGGAGTSANMNANEVIANRAQRLLQGSPVHPNDHVNAGQSTNDVYPTCGKLALYGLTDALRHVLMKLADALHEKAETFDDVVKMGRTQLQDALPIRLGQEFSAYERVVRREHRRLTAAQRELLTIPLGGTAIGTGVNAHPVYRRSVVPVLAELTGIPFVQGEDLIDATQNLDWCVCLSSALKSCAVSLSKLCNDLRLMSSGPAAGLGEIRLPARQNGSSIMPGKVNPVIPEVVNQIAFRVIGFDVTVSMAVEAGQLELNAFEPVIFDSLLQGLRQLTAGVSTLTENCIRGIEANRDACRTEVERSACMAAALCPALGYAQASAVAKEALRSGRSVEAIVREKALLPDETAHSLLIPEKLTSLPA